MTGRRSNRLLVFAIVGAVAAGGLAALLKPPPTAPSTTSVSIPATEGTPVDPASLQRRLLDELVLASAGADPAGLPGLVGVVAQFSRGGDPDGILARLLQDDVPASLRLAFVEKLPRGERAGAAADTLLGPLLTTGEAGVAARAFAALQKHGRVRGHVDRLCGCGFAVHGDGTNATLVAYGLDGGVTWEPQRDDDGWVLGLTRAPDAPRLVARSVDLTGARRVARSADAGAVLELRRETR